MKVHELLTERIHFTVSQQDAIENVFRRWIQRVEKFYQDQDITEVSQYDIRRDYKKLTNGLRTALSSVVRSIIKPHLPSSEVMQNYIEKKYGVFKKDTDSIENFLGHTLHIDIFPENVALQGSINDRWSKLYGSGKQRDTFKLYNTLSLQMSPAQIAMILKNKDDYYNDKYYDNWVSNVMHEITHVIQSLRSSQQRIHHKRAPERASEDERYLASDHEIDAYAQTVASMIIADSRRYDDPIARINMALQMMSHGVRTVFGREMFAGPDYERIRDALHSHTKDPKYKQWQRRAWRRFQKILVNKLLIYKEQLGNKK